MLVCEGELTTMAFGVMGHGCPSPNVASLIRPTPLGERGYRGSPISVGPDDHQKTGLCVVRRLRFLGSPHSTRRPIRCERREEAFLIGLDWSKKFWAENWQVSQ